MSPLYFFCDGLYILRMTKEAHFKLFICSIKLKCTFMVNSKKITVI